MSLNYARELLKISISQLCDVIGFDTTSEIAIDILVDVCERQFQSLIKQTSNLIQLNTNSQPTLFDILAILFQNNYQNLENLQEYFLQFQSLPFSQNILQFPYKKRNQFYLRIPPKDSQQIVERDQNQSTDYIYDWLPLFPHQETPEQHSFIHLDTTLHTNTFNDQDKKIDKSDCHNPLTLLSFVSKNGEESNSMPIGKRPNRSLPSILYRPRRIIEIEAAAAAAEKAKKEQLEKENGEKDQQQGPPPPLRFTIPKPLVTNDKTSLPIKKTTTTTGDGIIVKKPLSTPSLNSISPSVNLGKKLIISPPIHDIIETHSQPIPSTNSTENLSNSDKAEDIVLDLSKTSSLTTTPAKLPTLKLNIKNVTNPQITNNSDIPPTATKKKQRPSPGNKPPTANPQKVNLKFRTNSLPLFGTTNESVPMISPPLIHPPEIQISSVPFTEPSTMSNPFLNDNKSTIEMNDSNTRIDQSLSSSQNLINSDEKKKKKKKKHHHDREEKRIKKEEDINENNQMEIDTIPLTSTPNEPPINNSSLSNEAGGGGIRLKIKLGKSSNPTESNVPSINLNSNEKSSPIRLTLPLVPSSSERICSPILTRPSIISTITRTPHRRKTGKVKRVPQTNDRNPIISSTNLPLNEDNTVSIDDLPLGERTSPNKSILNIQETIQTPIRKKINKKKINPKRTNNILGVAVIEERRIHHDSQEKIWICPSCNRPDNGQEAMIACDLCDDWYHWECVGIVEEPLESIPWFCPKCHRSNSSTASAQGIKPSASSKAKRKRASALYQQKQQYSLI